MKTKILATTAALLISTAAFAANESDTETQNTRDETYKEIFSDKVTSESKADERGYFEASHGQILATTLIGKYVYTGKGEEAENIGDVNDLVMGPNGQAHAVIIGVGGFLGIGEKDVAVDFDRLSWTNVEGTKTIVIDATREELNEAPAYNKDALEAEDKMDNAEVKPEDESGETATQ